VIFAELRIGASGISWRSSEDGRIVNVPVHDLKWVEWLRVARNFQLRVGLKGDRRREAFDGFLRQVSVVRELRPGASLL
jgi:structure-specific recognition protein 1